MASNAARISAILSALTLAAVLTGCGSEPKGAPLTISFQAPSGGALTTRAGDMRRAAILELEAIDSKVAGHELHLVLGPVPDSIATIDALAKTPQQVEGQLMVSLVPPLRRGTKSPGGRTASISPQIWLAPPQATAATVTREYAQSGATGATGAKTDSPLIAGTPKQRYVTAALGAHEYPPAGSAFFEKFEDKYGRAPDRWAIYGYEAVGLVVDAITRLNKAGEPITQEAVAQEALKIRNRYSPLGHYDILPSGQTTLYTFQVRGSGAPDGPGSVLEAMR